VSAVSLQEIAQLYSCYSIILKLPDVGGNQPRFMVPPGLRGERSRQKVCDIAYSFSKAYQLPIEKAGFSAIPEEIARMAVMVDKRQRRG